MFVHVAFFPHVPNTVKKIQVCVQETAEEFSSKLKTLLEEDAEAFADSVAGAEDNDDDDEASGSASKKKKGKGGKGGKKAGGAATKGESVATTADRE